MNERVSLKIKHWTFVGERMKQKIRFKQLYQNCHCKKNLAEADVSSIPSHFKNFEGSPHKIYCLYCVH